MTSRRLALGITVLLSIVGAPSRALATTISLAHLWLGVESSGTIRLFRDGVPSVAGTSKPFPGTVADNPTYFFTYAFNAQPGTAVTVTPTVENGAEFLSLYDTTFNLATLNINYLGDQGLSDVTAIFSVTAPASGHLVFVANTAFGGMALGSIFQAEVTFTPPPVPEPASLALLASGLAGLAMRLRRKLA
jgi:hypothetical protein